MGYKARIELYIFLIILLIFIFYLLYISLLSIFKGLILPFTFYLTLIFGILFYYFTIQDWILHKTVYKKEISKDENRMHYVFFYLGCIPLTLSLILIYFDNIFVYFTYIFLVLTLILALYDEFKDHNKNKTRSKEDFFHYGLWASGIITLISWIHYAIFLNYEGLRTLIGLI